MNTILILNTNEYKKTHPFTIKFGKRLDINKHKISFL